MYHVNKVKQTYEMIIVEEILMMLCKLSKMIFICRAVGAIKID